ncbi:MAG: DUF4956 domain-containing protein [Hespellia sp.]|nr:DUF4956 domain-containing protein [Hespellia sp.]
MFTSILSTVEGSMTLDNALLCTAVSLVLGIAISFIYMMSQGTYTKSFAITLALLPVLVQCVIMMVNGNLGTSVAVLGTFSLVRFRSVAGSSSEIASVFFAMAIGLATGMGFVTFAALITLVIGTVYVVLGRTEFGELKNNQKDLRITIAENLDYTEIFDDIFQRYTKKSKLEQVKTTNLGSMYELKYHVTLNDEKEEKAMIDEIRCRNGNLTVVCGRMSNIQESL